MLHSSTTPSFNLVKEGVLSWYMKYLGIDYGEKRIGVAVSDPRNSFAMPVEPIEVRENPPGAPASFDKTVDSDEEPKP